MASNQDDEKIPPAQLTRTLAHMNKDHRQDLQHILQHYNSLPEAECLLPEMLDLTFETMTFRVPSTGGKQHVIHLDPPLQKWEDRRVVLVGMTHKARSALGIVSTDDDDDDEQKQQQHGKPEKEVVVVQTYVPPRPLDWVIFWAVLGYYIIYAFVRLGYFDDGTAIARVLDEWWVFFPLPGVPKGSGGFRWLTETIFGMVIAIHVAETWWLDRTRLSRFGVQRGTKVWLLWMGSCAVEGAMAFKRFDILVERLKGEKKRE
ncbi:hypothetical protein QBC43DRAFT_314289 [Cladorrhinum sp. PSN259]|nr:hypothetical protein QBC43DRAFT_314289 [Cladorrhinum sp. PSN259]